MPHSENLDPEDIPGGHSERASEQIRDLLAKAGARDEIMRRGMAAFNAEQDQQFAEMLAEGALLRAKFKANFVGPPLPRGFRARQERERRKKADMRALLRRLKD